MEQGSKEWKEYRRNKIGASDAAAIMGLSPWKTARELYFQKIDGTEDFVNPAMRRGTLDEPIARSLFIRQTGIFIKPWVNDSKERPWQMASLDGITEDMTTIVEIKCGSKELHEQARLGEIPIYYQCQLQHQISVCNPETCYYVSYHSGEIIILEVERNQAFIDDMLIKEAKFAECLEKKEPPELSEGDFQHVEHERGSQLLEEYKELNAQEKDLKKRKDAVKEELIEIGPKTNFILNGTKIYQAQSTSYDFSRMKEDGIDLDSYKKLSKPYWTISSRGKSTV